MEGPEFLSKKYPDLPGSRPVERAVEKKLHRGEAGPTSKDARVDAYLDRLEAVFKDERGFELLKSRILEKYVTKFSEISESYWKSVERMMRERGEAGDLARATDEQKAELRHKNAEIVLTDQRASLEQWLDYFASSDSAYVPKALKYWIFRSVLQLQEYDKEKHEFPRRSKGTVKPFPDINHEALSYVVDAVIEKLAGRPMQFEYDIQPQEREAFLAHLTREDFTKLYGWANELRNPIPDHLLPVTEGEWRTYPEGSDPDSLIHSIRGKGTGWCTAGEHTAKTQLQGGDFYVYYSLDDAGQPTMPRVAVRMEGDRIAEVRGIAFKQNLDPYMGPILDVKLNDFGPEGAAYKKRSADMQQLTSLEQKQQRREPFTKEDLTFLYELEAPIEGFGYQTDPRIAELRSQRNPAEDALIIFGCTPEKIAHNAAEINEHTKAYLGPLELGMFDALPEGVEHVYTKFPEEPVKFRRAELGTGIETGTALKTAIEARGMRVYDWASEMLRNREFTAAGEHRDVDLAEVSVASLGFSRPARYDAICARAGELGLELCPAEVGPQLRLQYTSQPLGEYLVIAMKAISVSGGAPDVFTVLRGDGGLWLGASDGRPDYEWNPKARFVFLRPRK